MKQDGEHDPRVALRSTNRDRKRRSREREARMHGNRRTQHVDNAIRNAAKAARKERKARG
jgi:hypothetical protein